MSESPSQIAHGVLRIVIGFLFLQHGLQKLFGVLTDRPAQELFSKMGFAGVLELLGGALIMVGFLTRPVAFVLCGLMAVAYFQAHQPGGWLPIQNEGELAVLYCFVFLYFSASGSGPLSIDRCRGYKKVEQR
jgi:putative oxidoreductase